MTQSRHLGDQGQSGQSSGKVSDFIHQFLKYPEMHIHSTFGLWTSLHESVGSIPMS